MCNISAFLSELMKSKEDLQEKCDSDRQDFVSRLSSLNQQHKMLKGRNEEMEADYGRLQQELQKLKEDQEHLESQRSQEFQQLKQEKELEIASYKDQVANYQRQNEQLQNEISSLKAQLQNSQLQLQYDQTVITVLDEEVTRLKNQAALQGQVPQQANGVQQQVMQQQANAQQPVVQQQPAAIQQQPAVQSQLNPDGNQQVQQQPVGQQQNIQQSDNQDNPAQQNQANAVDAGQAKQGGAANEVDEQHQIQPPDDAEAAGQGKEPEFRALNNKLEEHHGQIFKPDFKQNEDILNQKVQMDNINNMNNIDLDHHDNRMEHEGPVNLQVQEPKLLGDKLEEQARQQMAPADALVANMAQFQHQGQMEIPNVGLDEKEESKQLVNRKGVRIDREEDGDQQYNDDNYDNKYDQDKDDANAGEDEEEEERGHFN
ncbi:hypothetical protein SNE40_014717 [Patella caerulea]|uniref:Uncharacterized protein n=1 Tax=Patella caerulea TaxID=87958 RepID=A0AAN8PTW3_PATCE